MEVAVVFAGRDSRGREQQSALGGWKGLHVFEQSLKELPRDHAGQRPEAVPRPEQQQERQPLIQRRPPGCQHGPAGCSVRCESTCDSRWHRSISSMHTSHAASFCSASPRSPTAAPSRSTISHSNPCARANA
jgi:hypothetical protein